MPDRNNVAVEVEVTSTTPAAETLQENLGRIRALAEWKAKTMPPNIAADTVLQMVRDLADGKIQNSDTQREILEAYLMRAMQLEESEPDSDGAEAQALLDSFDGRLTEAEKRIDRVLARLGVE